MQKRNFLTHAFATLAIAAMPAIASAQLVTVSSDNFDDGVTTTNTGPTAVGNTTWTEYTNDTVAGTWDESVSGSSLQTAGNNDWGRVEYQDNSEYTVPSADANTTRLQFSWTVGNIAITNDGPANADYRVQLNVNDAAWDQNATADGGTGAERWVQTGAGTLSLDLFFEDSDSSYQAQVFNKLAADPIDDNGSGQTADAVAAGNTNWDFANTQETFFLTMDAIGYEWTSTIADFNPVSGVFATEFTGGEFLGDVWAGSSSQNNNDGRGSATFTNISVARESVAAIPEPSSALLLCGTLGMYVLRRRRS